MEKLKILLYSYNKLVVGKDFMIISTLYASLVRENVLSVACFNKAVGNNHSFCPAVVIRRRLCGKALKGAGIYRNVVRNTVYNMV